MENYYTIGTIGSFQKFITDSCTSIGIPLLTHRGHFGFTRTYKWLAGSVYWQGMKKTILQYVRECFVCQKSKYEALSPVDLLQRLPIPELIWEDVSMDFIIGLLKSQGYEVIMVVVDRFSKYAHFIPLRKPFTTKTIAENFEKEIVRLNGFPKTIVSGRDLVFFSNFWKEMF